MLNITSEALAFIQYGTKYSFLQNLGCYMFGIFCVLKLDLRDSKGLTWVVKTRDFGIRSHVRSIISFGASSHGAFILALIGALATRQ